MSDPTRDKLKAEVLAIPVGELLPHFARGALLLVAPELDLLDAAVAIASDHTPSVEGYLRDGLLRRASDDDGRSFVSEPTMRAQFVIVQPWVVAQLLPQAG